MSNQTGQDEALVGPKGSVNYSVNGGRVEYNSYLVDGGDILNASINGNHSSLIVYPSVDAIGDMQILTSNYGAQYGRSASGTILIAHGKNGAEAPFMATGISRRAIMFSTRETFSIAHRPHRSTKSTSRASPSAGLSTFPGHTIEKKDKTFFFRFGNVAAR